MGSHNYITEIVSCLNFETCQYSRYPEMLQDTRTGLKDNGYRKNNVGLPTGAMVKRSSGHQVG